MQYNRRGRWVPYEPRSGNYIIAVGVMFFISGMAAGSYYWIFGPVGLVLTFFGCLFHRKDDRND